VAGPLRHLVLCALALLWTPGADAFATATVGAKPAAVPYVGRPWPPTAGHAAPPAPAGPPGAALPPAPSLALPTLSFAPGSATAPPSATSDGPAWAGWLNPLGSLALGLLGIWRLAHHHADAWAPLWGPAAGSTVLQLRAKSGVRKSSYGQRKPSWWEILVGRVKGAWRWVTSTFWAFVRWVRNSPIDVTMILIFLCSWALWLNPSLEYLFLVQGFRNPLAFLGSGFACFNIYQLYSDIFYVYILGKAYCVDFNPKELAVYYGGGTILGGLLVALTPGGWMGPTAGTAALLTAFMLRYPGTPMAIPMIPLIFFPFQVRWIGTILAAANFYLFTKGVASGAAFTGGVLFALLLQPRKELKVQEISLSV